MKIRTRDPLYTYLADVGRHRPRADAPLPDDRNAVVAENLALVVSIARDYRGRGLDLEDLIQAGNLGLIRAADLFDRTRLGPSGRPIRFSTYATFWIRQGISKALKSQVGSVRLPYYLRDALVKWHRTAESRDLSPGEIPSCKTIAEALNITIKRARPIRDALEMIAAHGLMPAIGREAGEDDTLATVADEAGPPGEVSDIEGQIAALRRALATLPDREREVLARRHGLGDREETLREIAEDWGVTREWVRQVEKMAMRRLEIEMRKDDEGRERGEVA